ncbi:DUF192 domain-containing protein [uncultured Shimia sp.]|uniref:DUF192 domain-containing protein n=1 Tax=uncultured Shimia sp. TaxID=573152 RepID=UPI00260A4A0B|nr:DUF192 domain-containing protein [uncultured Shimia sp.]
MLRHLLLGAACTLIWLTPASASSVCRDDTLQLRGEWGEARFRVEVADSAEERAVGLMHRDSLSAGAGMLFVFSRTEPVSFWMENTLIELDMLFIAENGQVTQIHSRAKPLDRTPISSTNDVRYVLEINGGMAQAMGIQVGSDVRHPSILQDGAVWPCEVGN